LIIAKDEGSPKSPESPGIAKIAVIGTSFEMSGYPSFAARYLLEFTKHFPRKEWFSKFSVVCISVAGCFFDYGDSAMARFSWPH
jgi:hypothetical protein